MADNTTTQAEVQLPVKGNLVISGSAPTPVWATYIARGLVGLSGLWVAAGAGGILKVWGVPDEFIHRMDVTLPVIATVVTFVKTQIGVKPSDNS